QIETQRATIADKLKKLDDPAAKDATAGGKKDAKDSAKNAEDQQRKAQQLAMEAQRLQQAIQQEQRRPRPNQQQIMQMNARYVMLQQQASDAGLMPDQQNSAHQEDQKKQNIEAERKKLQNQDSTLAAKA